VKGYTLYGDYIEPNPPSRIIAAVARGDIDVAIAWGPLAGYFAGREGVPLTITPVTPALDAPALPMAYSISAGVRHGDTRLLADINQALKKSAPEIARILKDYHVPTVDPKTVPVLPGERDND
jgi:mxaJ protein